MRLVSRSFEAIQGLGYQGVVLGQVMPFQKQRQHREDLVEMIEQYQSLRPSLDQDEEDVTHRRLEALVDAVLHEYLEEGRKLWVSAQLVGQKHAPDRHGCRGKESKRAGRGRACMKHEWCGLDAMIKASNVVRA